MEKFDFLCVTERETEEGIGQQSTKRRQIGDKITTLLLNECVCVCVCVCVTERERRV